MRKLTTLARTRAKTVAAEITDGDILSFNIHSRHADTATTLPYLIQWLARSGQPDAVESIIDLAETSHNGQTITVTHCCLSGKVVTRTLSLTFTTPATGARVLRAVQSRL